jgi:amino acid permease
MMLKGTTVLLILALASTDAFMLFRPAVALPALSASSSLVSPLQPPKAFIPNAAVQSSFAAVPEAKDGAVSRGGAVNTEGASITVLMFNLVKNIVGAGVLSLPAGVAAFGDAPSALLPAIGITVFVGYLSAYCFALIGRVCSVTGATSYRNAWDRSVGESSSWIPASACTFKTGVACLAYSMILADTFRALLATAGVAVTRTQSLFGLTGTILLPLCMLKDLAALAPFSLLGILGMGFTICAMLFRFLGGTYALAAGAAPAGKFLNDLAPAVAPKFGTAGWKAAATPQGTILLCMLSTAYLAHYNAPKFFNELKNNTPARFNKLVGASFSVAIALCVAVMSVGFLTFGANSSGLILNNYSNKDSIMTMCRIAVAVSIVFSYPLAFVGVREGVFDLMNVPVAKRTDASVNRMTMSLLAAVTASALVVKDLSLVLALGGAVLGNALIFVFPSMMFRAAFKNQPDMAGERAGALGVSTFGVVMGAIGVYMSLNK